MIADNWRCGEVVLQRRGAPRGATARRQELSGRLRVFRLLSPQRSAMVEAYCARTRRSAQLAEEARGRFPSGITHDSRYLLPYPIYVERASGARKWDVDGHAYVDYCGGHGALLLGHNPPQVTAAVQVQLSRGTHLGASHAGELEWAGWVQQLMPSAERVRFTSSGTEATLLALRLARAFTGRSKVVRLAGHFHGWQDHVAFGVSSHFDGTPSPGVLAEVARGMVVAPAGDVRFIEALLAGRHDVAAVIVEPTGASWGQIPLPPGYVAAVRELTAARGVLLVLDEVISGFRCAPGGAQQVLGVRPDLTTLAKILAGGLPGGAVVGRKEVLDLLDYEACIAAGREKIAHHGTFNANPLSAAAGIATLAQVATTDACQRANDYAARLRGALDEELRRARVSWTAYGSFSGFHLWLNPEDGPAVSAAEIEQGGMDFERLKARPRPELLMKLRLGMLLHGVDIFSWPGGPTSAVHSDEDLVQTVEALRGTLAMLRAEGELG